MSSDTEPFNAIDALRDSLGDDALPHRLNSQDTKFEPHKKDFPNVVRQNLLLGSIRGNQLLRRTSSCISTYVEELSRSASTGTSQMESLATITCRMM
jgi:hypothetical protein